MDSMVNPKTLDRLEHIVRKSVRLYLWIAFVATVYMAYVASKLAPGVFADWFINYQGGWVRRGLCGEILLSIAHISGISLFTVTFLLIAAAVSIYFGISLYLLERQDKITPFLWIIVAPFTFTFHLNAAALTFRKEILYIDIIMVLVLASNTAPKRIFKKIATLAMIAYPFLLLCHEMLIVFLPYVLAILLKKSRKIWEQEKATIFLSALNLGVAAFIILHHTAYASQIQAIQDSLPGQIGEDHLPTFTTPQNAITALGWSVEDGMRLVQYNIHNKGYLPTYLLSLFLVIPAFVPIFSRLKWILRNRYSSTLIALSFIATDILGMVMIDWGRLIYTHALSWFALSLLKDDNSATISWFGDKHPIVATIWSVMAIPYSILWHIPCCGGSIVGNFLIHP